MSSATLLDMARIISKDSDDGFYSTTQKYRMLSLGQEAIANLIDIKYLDLIKKETVIGTYDVAGAFSLPSDFLRPCYFEYTVHGTEIEFINVESKGLLRNSLEGGTDLQPKWYSYMDASNSLKGKVIAGNNPTTDVFYYIRIPPEISASQEPILIGFDSQILAYYKHIFHLMEGQADLAAIAHKAFMEMLMPFISMQQRTVSTERG